jgi:hypothetical protein
VMIMMKAVELNRYDPSSFTTSFKESEEDNSSDDADEKQGSNNDWEGGCHVIRPVKRD